MDAILYKKLSISEPRRWEIYFSFNLGAPKAFLVEKYSCNIDIFDLIFNQQRNSKLQKL